jgi:hypothetical protein
VTCYNGHEVKVDCGAAGMTCATSEPAGRTVGACVPPVAAGVTPCDPSAPARCDGATIKYCEAGQPRSFLCKALGFNKCVNGASGAHCG